MSSTNNWRIVQPQGEPQEEQFYAHAPLVLLEAAAAAAAPSQQQQDPSSAAAAAAAAEAAPQQQDNSSRNIPSSDPKDTATAAAVPKEDEEEEETAQQTETKAKEISKGEDQDSKLFPADVPSNDNNNNAANSGEALDVAAATAAAAGVVSQQQPPQAQPTGTAAAAAAATTTHNKEETEADDSKITANDKDKDDADVKNNIDPYPPSTAAAAPQDVVNREEESAAAAAVKEPATTTGAAAAPNNNNDNNSNNKTSSSNSRTSEAPVVAAAAELPRRSEKKDGGKDDDDFKQTNNKLAAPHPPHQQPDGNETTPPPQQQQQPDSTAAQAQHWESRTFAEDAEHRYPAFVRHYTQQQQQQQKYAVDTPLTTSAAPATTTTAAVTTLPPARSVARATRALQERLAHAAVDEALLRRLLWQAVLEECQAAWYRARRQQADAADAAANASAKPPSHSSGILATNTAYYLDSSNSDDDDNDVVLWLPSVSFTPAQLVQRIKQGCAAAWRHESEKLQLQQQRIMMALQQQKTLAVAAAEQPPAPPPPMASRRSRRAVATNTKYTERSEPPDAAAAAPRQAQPQSQQQQTVVWWKVQPGGRVARALLRDDENENNKSTNQRQSNLVQRETSDDPDTEMAATAESNEKDGDGPHPEEMDASYEEEEVEEEDAASEEEEEELVEDDDDDDDEDDDDDDDDDEDEILISQNPYLQPDRTALLEWLGRKLSKTLSTLDVQPLLADMVHFDVVGGSKKKKNAPQRSLLHELGAPVDELFQSPVDRRIVAELFLLGNSNGNALWPRFSSGSDPRAVADFLLGNNNDTTEEERPRLVLQPPAAYEADDADLTAWEVGSFGRTLFKVRLVHAAAAAALKGERAAVAQQQHAQEQERRAWENYRARGTLVGYCQWSGGGSSESSSSSSSWMQVAAASLPSASAAAATKTDSEEDAAAAPAPAPAAATASTVSDDLALAQALGTASGRRKTRRDGGGVFYGNQSSMTAKNLMDALLRVISGSSSPVSLAGLLHVAPDESSDPMRRIRMAVGKLVWKRNQLARLEVQLEWSDAPIWNKLCQGPIWRPTTTTLTTANGAPVAEDGEEAAAASTSKASASGADSDEESLVRYVRNLHQTELQLRALVMAKICELPVAFIATAADERAGSMEAMDNSSFEDTANIQWHSSGHELLGSRILRPATARETSESSVCSWFEINAYVPSVESSGVPEDPVEIGRAKEPTAVECRMRFLADPVSNIDDYDNNNRPPSLILTEAQVRAGIKAAEIDQSSQSEEPEAPENPFTSGNAEILLLETDRTAPPTSAVIVGHESAASMEDNRIQHKILLLPNKGSASEEAFWATLDLSSPSGAMSCTADGDGKLFTIQPRDFHPSSAAYQECLAIVRFLQRHPKGVPFLEPVDPIALGIPEYHSIIDYPMDVSTVLKKLERGDYANIPSGQMKGHSPVFRMLNGPFRKDVELIFDNAMYFNPPDDWIHQAAAVIKKSVTKKIDQASSAADRLVQKRKQKSVYVDYDSDVDMYVYESDDDDDYNGKRKRKRKSAGASRAPPAKEDSSLRAIERGIRLQKVLSDSVGLRGPFSKIPLSTNASEFSLPSEWSCHHKTETADQKVPSSGSRESVALPELDELMVLHRQVEESEHIGVRRSTRAHDYDQDAKESAPSLTGVEYFSNSFPNCGEIMTRPGNRLEIELVRERMHESHFAKLYQTVYKSLGTQNADQLGIYSKGFFPPYLGRVVPFMSPYVAGEKTVWEIREQFVVPALKWVIRGLIHSEHLTEVEPLDSAGGVIIPNHLYYIDESQTPFDILDTKELTRRKRADAEEEESSEEEVELSEYEKARAERVARNKERLQALGLA